tara:strand:+ start:305 stop:1342 length:1038 start_codon:yes stop_codon:yes gene_type:complete
MSKVLVITPAYCTEENCRLPLLLQTIYWVQQQTYKDYLHIVVDDGSTDSTMEVLERVSRADPNLKVFSKENGGSSRAINYGLEQALLLTKPDYITVCHSDDLLLPNSLDVRVQLASKTGADFVYTDSLIIFDSCLPPKRKRSWTYSTPDELFRALLQDRSLPYVTMFWSADFFLHKLQGYDSRLTSAEDWDIAIRSAKELAAMRAIHATTNCMTVAKRRHKNSLTHQNLRDGTRERCDEIILKKHLNDNEYQAMITRARPTRPQYKSRRQKVLARVAELQRPRVLHNALKFIYNISNKVEIDPCAKVFLKKIKKVNYEKLYGLALAARRTQGLEEKAPCIHDGGQ